MDVLKEVVLAENRVAHHVQQTPLEPSPYLSEVGGAEVYLKLESLQHTGSFKVRGAFNKLLSLSAEERERGVVAASSGNHGAAVAHAANQLGVACEIFVPEGASRTKVRAIRDRGVEVRFHGADAAQTEEHAREYAEDSHKVYVSPYNDSQVVGGQGTIAAEIAHQLGDPALLDAIFVPVGGGGLVSGIAGYLKELAPDLRVVGCQPVNSAVMAASVEAGQIVEAESKPTLSDGTAGGVEPGAITFDLCCTYVDEWVLVSEEEIAAAMRAVVDLHRLIVEGATGVGVAAFLKKSGSLRGQTVAIVLCGANVETDILKGVL